MAQTQVVNTTKTVELVKERSNMVKARKDAHLSQKDVAQKMNVDVKSVINWEKAHTDPRHYQIDLLREVIGFAGTDKELLQVFILEESNQEPCHQEPTRDILESTDSHPFVIHIPRSVRGFREFMEMFRRQFIEALAHYMGASTLFGNVSLAIVSSPTVDPDEYLSIVGASIGTWWQWYYQGNNLELERVLLKNVPVLKRLATTISPFQSMAASLAVEAKVLQIILATRNLQFKERELHCVEAVRFGELSGDRTLHAIALDWYGNTHTVCYHQPKKALPILNDALSALDSDTSSLTRSAIYSNLSIVHAQVGDETEALKYVELAHSAMPARPELAPFSQCIQWNQSVLDAIVGKVYLHLTDHALDSDYARMACDVLEKSINKLPLGQTERVGALIRKGDATRALGDLRECVKCLTDGVHIAIDIGSLRRLVDADDVLHRIPPEWKREKAIQSLQKDISHALVVVRR